VAERAYFMTRALPSASKERTDVSSWMRLALAEESEEIAAFRPLFLGDRVLYSSDLLVLSPDLRPVERGALVLSTLNEHPEWADLPFHRATELDSIHCDDGIAGERTMVVQCSFAENRFEPFPARLDCTKFIPNLVVCQDGSNVSMAALFRDIWDWKFGSTTQKESGMAFYVRGSHESASVQVMPEIPRRASAPWPRRLFTAGQRWPDAECDLCFAQIVRYAK
jgi:hypothetical protein